MRWSDLIRSFRGSSTSPQGSPWPNNGEIDMLEGQAGRSCTQTHYGTLQPNDHASGNSASICAPLGYTGWITVSVWRTGEQVKVWYNRTFMGKGRPPVAMRATGPWFTRPPRGSRGSPCGAKDSG
jgi:hypothetical protein